MRARACSPSGRVRVGRCCEARSTARARPRASTKPQTECGVGWRRCPTRSWCSSLPTVFQVACSGGSTWWPSFGPSLVTWLGPSSPSTVCGSPRSTSWSRASRRHGLTCNTSASSPWTLSFRRNMRHSSWSWCWGTRAWPRTAWWWRCCCTPTPRSAARAEPSRASRSTRRWRGSITTAMKMPNIRRLITWCGGSYCPSQKWQRCLSTCTPCARCTTSSSSRFA
mmetsp:Transcript_41814/g.79887  ORF Transcript_41814/g.79887 Transcript_41814/m.79887 type:complete len:224 (-) Transcript_41814:3286-3957(-)